MEPSVVIHNFWQTIKKHETCKEKKKYDQNEKKKNIKRLIDDPDTKISIQECKNNND